MPVTDDPLTIVDSENEPARYIGYITGAVTANIGLLAAFGLDLDNDQRNAILTFIAAYVPIIVFMVEMIRRKVYSPATVKTIRRRTREKAREETLDAIRALDADKRAKG